MSIAGNTLRLHWLAAFRRDGKLYFLGDSKRPGHLTGPYASVDEFIADYAVYRNRPIVSHAVLESYQRKQRTLAAKQSRQDGAP